MWRVHPSQHAWACAQSFADIPCCSACCSETLSVPEQQIERDYKAPSHVVPPTAFTPRGPASTLQYTDETAALLFVWSKPPIEMA
eukprot:349715-Chlamydomonas_euryale.AAC.3